MPTDSGEVDDESESEDEEIADESIVYMGGEPILLGPDKREPWCSPYKYRMVCTKGSATFKCGVGINLWLFFIS